MSYLPNLSNLRKPKVPAVLTAAAVLGTPGVFVASSAADQGRPPVSVATPTRSVPAAPAAPVSVSRYQYTVRLGEAYMVRAQDSTVASAQQALAKAQPGDCLVVDRAGKRYLVTDAATLRRIRENNAPLEALGKRMEAQGKQMEETGKPMEALGKQMEALGEQMEAVGNQIEEQGKLLEAAVRDNKSEADRQAIQERMRALQQQMSAPQQEMRALAQKMREQAARMRPQGDQMREYGRQMRAASKQAEERMVGIIDAAFQNNLAKEQTEQPAQ